MHRHSIAVSLSIVILSGALASACAGASTPAEAPTIPPPTVPAAAASATPQPPKPVNPLSGLEVEHSSLLRIPVVLISISHFPATARPQAGLSFSPFVYEFYITEGATRFLAAFYGEWPAPEVPVHGGCEPRVGPFVRSANLLGNRVWFDEDADGLQDPGEDGIVGLCVNLLSESGKLIAQTASDSNGFYGFDVPPGIYSVEFLRPAHLTFAASGAGDELRDSDVDPATGLVRVDLGGDDFSVDAGLSAASEPAPTPGEGFVPPRAQVGPIRSGRLIYRHLARSFQNSCLVFAYASPEVLARLPQCAVVFHQIEGGGYMLDLDELWTVAKANQQRSKSALNYSGYEFSDAPPPDGQPATALEVFFAYQNQSGWYYDPLSRSYMRYVDTSERRLAGILHPDTDRLTGRQLQFQNLIVLYAKHEVITPTNLDIHLDPGRTGKATLFRDGLALDIDWSTREDAQGEADHPIQFLQKNGEVAQLRPGHTWVIIVTPETTIERGADGNWKLFFVPPDGAQ